MENNVLDNEIKNNGEKNMKKDKSEKVKIMKKVINNIHIINFIFVALICVTSLVAFFISLNKFGPTIAGSAILAFIFCLILTLYLMKKVERKPLFYGLTIFTLCLTFIIIYVTNLIMFVI